MSLLKLLGSSSFLMANKEIAKITDLECAILLSDLAGAYDYWNEKGLLKDGCFFRTQKDIETNTTLSSKVQLRCIKILTEKGFIKTKLKGAPPVKYFYIDIEFIKQIINQSNELDLTQTDNSNSTNGIIQTIQMVENELYKRDNSNSTNSITNNNKINNNIEIIIENNKRKEPPPKKEIKNVEELEFYHEFYQILSYLSEKTNVKYQIPDNVIDLKKYKHYTVIKELLKEGNTHEKLIEVINLKFDEWNSDDKMYRYIRTDVLFRKSNFEKYLIELQMKNNFKYNNQNNQKNGTRNYQSEQEIRQRSVTNIIEMSLNALNEQEQFENNIIQSVLNNQKPKS